jgi:hypothetical protein
MACHSPALSAGGGGLLASGYRLISWHLATAAFQPKRIVLVLFPAGRIAEDVLADAPEVIVSNDAFMVIALPDGMEVGVCQEPFRHADFEPADD